MEQLDETDRKTLGAWLLAEREAHSALRREPPREDHERARRGRGERLTRLAELQTESRQRLGTFRGPGVQKISVSGGGIHLPYLAHLRQSGLSESVLKQSDQNP